MNLALQYNHQYPNTLVLERTGVCCHEFDPSEWDYTQRDWSKKLFLQVSVQGLFLNPFTGAQSKAMARILNIAKRANAIPSDENAMVLVRPVSPFRTELFMAVSKEVPNQKTIRLSGSFVSRVFEGRSTSQCVRGLNGYLTSVGKISGKYYFHYPYCSYCAKHHGHNYTVAIAETKLKDFYC